MSASAPSAMDLLKTDGKDFIARYRTALQLDRWVKHGRQLQKRDRGTLMGTVRLLYEAEERIAREALAEETKKAKRKAAQDHHDAKAAAAAAAATVALTEQLANTSLDAAPSQSASSASASTSAAKTPAAAQGAAAIVAAKIAAASSLHTIPLPSQCNVCYSDFNTVAPASDDDAPLVLRCHMTLCGHAGICTDCFTSYVTSHISSGEGLLPFIKCPEPHCGLPLHSSDLVADVPTAEAVAAFEAEYARAEELRVKRNHAALDAKHASTLQKDAPQTNLKKGRTKVNKSKQRKQSNGGSGSNSNSGSDDSSDDDGSHHSSSAPIAPSLPSSKVESKPLVPSDALLTLVIHMMSKLLQRSRDWLPCGTFVKLKDDEDETSDVAGGDAEATTAAASSSSSAASSSATTAAPAAATPAVTLNSCPFGFYLVAPLWTPGSRTRPKKCEFCQTLQELRPKNSGDGKPVALDPEVAKMIADGTLRPCPICECMQMRDKGMCNVIQCPSCAIYWNWSDRSTGKSESALKNRARMQGSLWEPGELQYQQNLQRTDLPAFIALLAKNGIEYRADYIRGSS